MIEVNKCNIDCEYIDDYWKNQLIVDQSKKMSSSKNSQTNDNQNKHLNRLTIDVNSYDEFKTFVKKLDELTEPKFLTSNNTIPNSDNEKCIDNEKYIDNEDYIENEDYSSIKENNNIMEKLNYNYKARLCKYTNGFRKKYIDSFGNSVSDKSNNTRTNTIYYSGEGSNRKQVSNSGLYNKQKSSEHRILQKYPYTSQDKGKMYELPKKCRIHEYESRERKILLDSFSKPKLVR